MRRPAEDDARGATAAPDVNAEAQANYRLRQRLGLSIADLERVDLLLELVARNRRRPVDVATMRERRDDLLNLCEKAGTPAWRFALGTAIDVAGSASLAAGVVDYVRRLLESDIRQRTLEQTIGRDPLALLPKYEPPPSPEATRAIRDRVRSELLAKLAPPDPADLNDRKDSPQ